MCTFAKPVVFAGVLSDEVSVEGFGISFIEAAASGIPAVASDSGWVRSAVRDGETGLPVPPADVAEVTAAARMLLTDSDRRKALVAAALRTAETQVDWDRVARETLDFARSVHAVARPATRWPGAGPSSLARLRTLRGRRQPPPGDRESRAESDFAP